MERACAWCKRELKTDTETSGEKPVLGMCAACHEFFFPPKGPPVFRKYLDRLAVPVLLVDDDARIVIANARVCSLLEKEPEEIEGTACGAAFDCANAELPGGCGKTEFCGECTIRQTIADTYVTGQSHENITAVLDSSVRKGGGDNRLGISTWRAGKIVLLKIGGIDGARDTGAKQSG